MKYLLIAVFLIPGFIAKAQNITKQQIDGWVYKCDTAYKASKISGYAFNKAVYEPKDSVKLNNDLLTLKNTDLLSIDPFWDEEISTKKTGKFTVLILKKGEQTNLIKQSTLKTALAKFTKPQPGKSAVTAAEPILLINGQSVPPGDCLARLSAVKVDDIADIYYSKHPVPAEYYGPNAKNGLIAVWTK